MLIDHTNIYVRIMISSLGAPAAYVNMLTLGNRQVFAQTCIMCEFIVLFTPLISTKCSDGIKLESNVKSAAKKKYTVCYM